MNNLSSLVSILIPTYNRQEFIAECIESALMQVYANIEVIVVDNASTDKTWEICQQFAIKDARVRAFRNDRNIGPVSNWLACLAQAHGEYIKILWSDDLIHPEYLTKTLPYLRDPKIGFVYSSVELFERAAEDKSQRLYSTIETSVVDSRKYIEGVLLGNKNYPYSPGCALFRTSDVKKNLMLHVPNRVASDFCFHAIGNDLLLFLLTAQHYPKFAVVNEPLSFFRAHQGSISTSAPLGKIPLHYDLAKGYFAENYVVDATLLKKLNTINLTHLLRFKARKYGITTLDDFYPTRKNNKIDLLFLIKNIFQRYFIKIKSR
ncbi:MAG: glycosyltransferase family 2 protein [Sideroxydans sp.]|nr:glycosyltransferase family 2 protein [Sideroxydans sp.]